MREPWLVLVNPLAGKRGDLLERTAAALDRAGIDVYRVDGPESEPAMRAIARGALSDGVRHFAVVGGDGTLNVVVDALIGADAPPVTVALLPAGTGSDFARTFALPQSVEGAASHLAGSTDYPLDVGILDGEWGRRAFVNVAQAGLGAACVRVADRLPRRLGALKYQVSFALALPRFPPAPVRLTVDGRRFEGDAIGVVFANGQFFGGGLNVAPRAATMDGLLDVLVLAAGRAATLALFPRIRRGMHLSDPAVRRFTGDRFRLEVAPEWPVEADGESVGSGPLEGHVLRGRLSLRL